MRPVLTKLCMHSLAWVCMHSLENCATRAHAYALHSENGCATRARYSLQERVLGEIIKNLPLVALLESGKTGGRPCAD